MFKKLVMSAVLALGDVYADNFAIPFASYTKPNFIKSKNRPFTKGKRQRSLKERSNRRKAKRGRK